MQGTDMRIKQNIKQRMQRYQNKKLVAGGAIYTPPTWGGMKMTYIETKSLMKGLQVVGIYIPPTWGQLNRHRNGKKIREKVDTWWRAFIPPPRPGE